MADGRVACELRCGERELAVRLIVAMSLACCAHAPAPTIVRCTSPFVCAQKGNPKMNAECKLVEDSDTGDAVCACWPR